MHSPGFDALLFWAYEFLAAFLPFLAFFYFRIRKQENRPSPFSRVSVLVFVFYIIALYHFTGAGTLYDGMRYRFSLPDQLNLIPFSNTIDPVGYRTAGPTPLGQDGTVPFRIGFGRRVIPVY